MKKSAGILMYRKSTQHICEVLLVHPGGPFFSRKQEGYWTIPKGEIENNDDPLQTAIREFFEETGHKVSGEFISLGTIKQKGGKQVEAWAIEGDLDAAAIRSNTFEIEWPPKSGKQRSFPEIDKAAWYPIEEARQWMNEAQGRFLEELAQKMSK